MALKKAAFDNKPNRCADNNAQLLDAMDGPEREAHCVSFVGLLSQMLDEAARGEDVYFTIGTTRDKSSFTASCTVGGNRETVYNTTVIGLLGDYTDLLHHYLSSDNEEEDPFTEGQK